MERNNTNFKYSEKEIIQEVEKYITSTYSKHYVGNKQIQTIDVWDSMGIAEDMCMGTLVKYAMRFGKKGSEENAKSDLLKLIHYAVLVYHFRFMEEK
tara:strand:- start:3666 stop:3956 length:291 start_codon:yes stop_codon:yes gene_type:complete